MHIRNTEKAMEEGPNAGALVAHAVDPGTYLSELICH